MSRMVVRGQKQLSWSFPARLAMTSCPMTSSLH